MNTLNGKNYITADFVGYKNELIFTHILDDTVIKILYLGYDTFVWIQYGPSECCSQSVEVLKTYREDEIKNIVLELFPLNDEISAIELFNRYLQSVK